MAMIPQYNTKLFTDFYPEVDGFIEDYKTNGLPVLLTDESISTLYYLLYAKYGNNPVANYDTNQFKYKVFAIIFQYGPTWEKRLDIQAKLRGLSEAELRQGAKTIMNQALNSDQEPNPDQTDELSYVNAQHTNKSTKSILGAYTELWNMLSLDVSKAFLDKFRPIFKTVVQPEQTYIYESEE